MQAGFYRKKIFFIKGDFFDGKLEPVELNKDGQKVSVYLLPYIKPFDVRPYYPEEEIDSYDRAVRTVLSHVDVNPEAVNVLVAHQFITGAVSSESETVMVGGLDNIGADAFDLLTMWLLDIIHGHEKCKTGHIRYCGHYSRTHLIKMRAEKSVDNAHNRTRKRDCGGYTCNPSTPWTLYSIWIIAGGSWWRRVRRVCEGSTD